jgi:hypothetical protein
MVVEPQELDAYREAMPCGNILALPFSNLGQGSIPARNWVWRHAESLGEKKHWILDDNIGSFRRMNRNAQIEVTSGTIFKAAEDFCDRYYNVALAGFQYDYFLPSKYWFPPIIFNTRIYSCILVNHSLEHKWRGMYNEDTDLSLRALKSGWCTVLFNAFIQEKKETLSMRGGNSGIYEGDGRLKMAESLVRQHPDVAKIGIKYGRPQHVVNYKPFKGNRLIKIENKEYPKIDDYGMVLIRLQSMEVKS